MTGPDVKLLPNAPVIRLEDTPRAVVRGRRAFPGTGVFLSMPKGELKSVQLIGNDLGDVRVAMEERAH